MLFRKKARIYGLIRLWFRKVQNTRQKRKNLLIIWQDQIVSQKNAEYIGYATPLPEAKAKLEESVQTDLAAYPADDILKNTEVFDDLAKNIVAYDRVWTEIKAAR